MDPKKTPERRKTLSTNVSTRSYKPTAISIPTSEEVWARLPKHHVPEHVSQPKKQNLPQTSIPGAMIFSYATIGSEEYDRTSPDSIPSKLASSLHAYRKNINICKQPKIVPYEYNNVTYGRIPISSNFKAAFIEKWSLDTDLCEKTSSEPLVILNASSDDLQEYQSNTQSHTEQLPKQRYVEDLIDDEYPHMNTYEVKESPRKRKHSFHETSNDQASQTRKLSSPNDDKETENTAHINEENQSHNVSSSEIYSDNEERFINSSSKFTLKRRGPKPSYKESLARINSNMDFLERLKILAPEAAAVYDDLEVVEESKDTDQVNTGHMKTHDNKRWKTKDTEEFYKV
ncbi:14790_t:CDS:2 [Acaulospora colombiana]|uniref:14790_t:CDS:1 n=1 Tax=Acaulospora colombiana TaxID=27376 RepID=A0ACA9M928_9GLOM|nr:14790_t:CDS:2 [Acaulospora colombiana]